MWLSPSRLTGYYLRTTFIPSNTLVSLVATLSLLSEFFYVPMSSVVSHTILVFFHSFPIVCKNTLSRSTIWWDTIIAMPARSRQSLLTTLPSWVNTHNQVPTHSPPHSQPQLSKGLVGCEQKLTMLVADESRAWQVCNCLHILVVHSC